MNYYIFLIRDVIDYIEENLDSDMSLSAIAKRTGMSAFHFTRIFKAVTGITLKQYILSRKLAQAQVLLKKTQNSVIEIALMLGFEYPEVFSRAFKRQVGISPSSFRKTKGALSETSKLSIMERDIMNYHGVLAIKGKIIHMDPITLCGVDFSIDTTKPGFRETINALMQPFIVESGVDDCYEKRCFYSIVKCSGREDGVYRIFCGRELRGLYGDDVVFQIPKGYYAAFEYDGDMFDIQEVFQDDLFRWLIVKEAVIVDNEIGMMTVYPNCYPEEKLVRIFVPVKPPNH